jgi:NADH-quinone oxidoreductase subunit J
MFVENTFFFLFSSLSIIFSFFVIISRNPVHSILSLILVFFNAASLLIILGAEFLAMLFVIVYVGAVAVLFLFVIMMLNIKVTSLTASIYRYLPISIIFGSIFFFEFCMLFYTDLASVNINNLYLFADNFINDWNSSLVPTSNILVLGRLLYTYYSYLFIVSSIILLVSMIGAISLTLHRRNDVKKQFIYKQIERDFTSSIIWKH